MFWWIRWVGIAALSIFFLIFGIEEMVRAYKADHPTLFLGSFFSASLIILISGTLLLGSLWRMMDGLRYGPDRNGSKPPFSKGNHPPQA